MFSFTHYIHAKSCTFEWKEVRHDGVFTVFICSYDFVSLLQIQDRKEQMVLPEATILNGHSHNKQITTEPLCLLFWTIAKDAIPERTIQYECFK